jgi:pilus assembly protein CpaE
MTIDPTATHTGEANIVLLPRITIAAYADNDQTSQVFSISAKDRRASRAHFEVKAGGIPAACRDYGSEKTPNVLIIETHGHREQVLMELAGLAEVCQPDTKVIVVGHVNDIVLYRELIKQGISDYIVAPITPIQLMESVAAIYNDEKTRPLGRVVSFVGTKGGVGSSTIAHNVAWYLSQHLGAETVITDLDLAYGTAGLNFDVRDASGTGIIEALTQPERVDSTVIDRLMNKLGERLNLLSAPSGVDRDINIESHAVEAILTSLRSSAPNIIVDVPYLWSPWIKYTLLASDDIVITATPELPSLRNAKSLVDMLKQARPNDRPPRLVLNQVGVPKRPEIAAADFSKALGIDPTVVIPHDPQSFGVAQGNGKMLLDVAPKAKATETLVVLSKALFGPTRELQPKKSGSLLDKLGMLKFKKRG